MEKSMEMTKKNATSKIDSVSSLKMNSKAIHKPKSHRIPPEESKR